MKILHTLILAAGVVLAGAAAAHDDGTLDPMKAPNGGQLRAAGVHHYELVEHSGFVPHANCPTPLPGWKQPFSDALPANDPARYSE